MKKRNIYCLEVLEVIAAMIVSPEPGDAYLGTQGDEWGAQKDALLALLGSIIAMGVVRLRVGGAVG